MTCTRTIGKALLTTALTAGLLAGSAGAASAHECFVAKRSDAGTTGAAHSANWHVLEVAHLFAEAHLFLQQDGGPQLRPLTEAEVAQAVGLAEQAGLPPRFALFTQQTIPVGKAGTAQSRDRKGIDHLDSYVGDLAGIYFQLTATATP